MLAAEVAFVVNCRTAWHAGPSLPSGPAISLAVPAPALRVGILTEAAKASLAADAGVFVVIPAGSPTGRVVPLPRATFLGVSVPGPLARFRVQVASLTDEAAAREISERARAQARMPSTIAWNREARKYQVRVGEFQSRDEARSVADRLARSGFEGAWAAEESPAGRMRLLETGETVPSASIVPRMRGEDLSVDGAVYRGVMEVRAGGGGTLTVINTVNIEDYLKGVVPNELSPSAFPQIEALKAQAVAARTYALRNRGQFEDRGFDICATPSCQVYRGRSTEDPLSSRAVDETRGLAASFAGKWINAFYTSTCGGHTEDGDNVFEGEAYPYLRGVACAPERSAWARVRTLASPAPVSEEEGLNRDVALLGAMGILDPHTTSKALDGSATETELSSWVRGLLRAIQRKGCVVKPEGPLTRRGTFLRYLVGSLCWDERERLLAPEDPDYLLQVEDKQDLAGEGERLAVALLFHEGILSPFPDNTLRPRARITRAQAVGVLSRTLAKAGAPDLRTGEFGGAGQGEITLRSGSLVESYPLEPTVRLFRAMEGSRAAVSELTMAAGEKVSFVLKAGRVTFLEAEQSRLGASADHTSRYYRWEVRLTPEEVAKSVARYGSVGPVRDVVPRRLGVSGRVVELAVMGRDDEMLLRGLKIRWALGLRENLFVVDRQLDAKGDVQRFVFTGKGWGHGVGLCQVGAFGMAQAGATFENILKHYYSHIGIEKAY